MVSSLMRWNARTLLSACELLLKRDDCTLRLGRITSKNVTAHNTYSVVDGHIQDLVLTVDPAQASLVEGFLHEALHCVLAEQLKPFNEALEEVLVQAIEQHLWKHTMRQGDTARWRRLINMKLK